MPAVCPNCAEDLVRARARMHAARLGAVMEQDGENRGRMC
jgi:hypothetical protein